MAKRDFDAPDKDLLSEREALAWLETRGLDLTVEAFRSLVADGTVFGQQKFSRQNIRYPWETVVSLLWRARLGGLGGSSTEKDDS